DCLMNIVERLEMESLVLDVPFVCKSWHKVTCNPQCWRRLDFFRIHPDYSYFDSSSFVSRFLEEYEVRGNFSAFGFLKSVVKLSDRSVTFLALPGCCTMESLLYVADK
ncbi:hypothetical protein U1Q18_030698, partial [Sarracenia purpurea var. burkii]